MFLIAVFKFMLNIGKVFGPKAVKGESQGHSLKHLLYVLKLIFKSKQNILRVFNCSFFYKFCWRGNRFFILFQVRHMKKLEICLEIHDLMEFFM